MSKALKRIAFGLTLLMGLMLIVSVGMSHWMNEAPLHHGEHECCDFTPIETSNSPKIFLLLLPSLAAVSFVILLYRPQVIQSRANLIPITVDVPIRRFLKGVVQRE